MKFLAITVRGISGGSQNYRLKSRDSHMNPFDTILHFFSLELTAVRLCAKFEISSFNSSRDIRVVPKLPNFVT